MKKLLAYFKYQDDSWRGGYDFFTEEEMRCKGPERGFKCDCGGKGLPPHSFMVLMVKLRKRVGKMIITSCYRCPSYNAHISDTGLTGPHTIAAADVAVFGPRAFLLVFWAIFYGIRRIGIKQHGPLSERFVHIDVSKKHPIPRIWSYK